MQALLKSVFCFSSWEYFDHFPCFSQHTSSANHTPPLASLQVLPEELKTNQVHTSKLPNHQALPCKEQSCTPYNPQDHILLRIAPLMSKTYLDYFVSELGEGWTVEADFDHFYYEMIKVQKWEECIDVVIESVR